MRHPLRGAVLQLLIVLPAASGAVRSGDEVTAMRRAYSEAERRCAKTGLTLLRFDGGDESASSPAARAARSRVEAERFETELRRVQKVSPLETTHAQHISVAKASTGLLDMKYRVPLNPSLDGNTVESSVEQMQFSENVMRYQSSLTFLNNRIAGLMSAIKGE